MKLTASQIWSFIEDIRKTSPVVHNITNYVAMNNSANALLAIGASPVMAHAEDEVEDMVGIAGALVINIGTLSDPWIRAMFRAAHRAKDRKVPVILDPVGAGATAFRTRTARELLREGPPAIIRGNASEIMALLDENAKTKGVDSTAASHDAVDVARQLSNINGCVVCVSGETDYIVRGDDVTRIMNGHAMMTRVTGMGCIASALCGAFAAVNGNYAEAAAQAMAVMGIAGEIAAQDVQGPGSLQVRFLDALYGLSERDVEHRLRTEG
ncbi:MAG: hydroxyethylthiazole kinase [Deltaproteobacteria bacterium HGW-Deltaproteobacteria-11]|nr:MAG: hydroxyethylthiazole kinase [Deltaproteobacteria bacterium HGW-Deltaproteobacteria-11]